VADADYGTLFGTYKFGDILKATADAIPRYLQGKEGQRHLYLLSFRKNAP
jgi:hypothetical protein